MALGNQLRRLARRLGYDVYRHMAGRRRIPLRVRRQIPIGPITRETRGIPEFFEVEVARCTSFAGFPYDPGDWNPLVATLREYEADPSLSYERSSMRRLHRGFQPGTLQEMYFGSSVEEPLYPLCDLNPVRAIYRYIWDTSPSQIDLVRKQRPGRSESYYFGPVSEERGRAEFERLVEAFRSIRGEGYAPERYGYVTGYLLGDQSTFRFVIGSGNHRLAALAALDVPIVRVRLHSHPAVIHRSQLSSWTTEHGGPFDPRTAQLLFDEMLKGSGRVKAERLGLL